MYQRLSIGPIFLFLVTLLFGNWGCESPDVPLKDPDYTLQQMSVSENRIIDTAAVSGQKSIRVSPDHRFALKVDLGQVEPNACYKATLYRYGDNPLTKLVANGSWGLYMEQPWSTASKGPWQAVELLIKVPPDVEYGELQFYAYHQAPKAGLVDSLSIRHFSCASDAPRLMEDYMFYPLLYKLLNDYAIRHQRALSLDSVPGYASRLSCEKLFGHTGFQLSSIQRTFRNEREKIGLEGIRQQLRKMARERGYRTVNLEWIPEIMQSHPLAGYLKQYVHRPGEPIRATIQNHYSQSYKARLYRLKEGYRQEGVKTIYQGSSSFFIDTPRQLTPGFYKLQLESDSGRFPMPLIINGNNSPEVVLLAPVTTWHAYNAYGGKSLYKNGIDQENVNNISAHRPLTSVKFDSVPQSHDIYTLKNIYDWFAKRYTTHVYPDYFLGSRPHLFDSVQTLILAQHCKYFSPAMYQRLKTFENHGNLLSLGANQVFWKVRWHHRFWTLECRKNGRFFQGTMLPGGTWRNPCFSEAHLLGVSHTSAGDGSYHPYRVETPRHPLFGNSDNLRKEDPFGERGIDGRPICGDETDVQHFSTPDETVLLAKGQQGNGGGQMVYRNRGRWGTLSCGCITCGNGLGTDTIFTRVIRNFMEKHHPSTALPPSP